MNKGINVDIRKHGFYIILLGILLVYVAIYFVLVPDSRTLLRNVRAMETSRGSIQERLQNPELLPNEAIIAYHRERGETLRKILDNIRLEFKNKDRELEAWFEDIEKEFPGQDPSKERFQAVYSRERGKLVDSYASKNEGMKVARPVQELGFKGFDETLITAQTKRQHIEAILPFKYQDIKDVVTPVQMRRAQKDFWLIKKMLNVFETGKIRRISQFTFKNEWPNSSDEVFFRRDIEVVGQIEYGELSILLEEVLNNPYFRTEIKKVSIKREAHRPELITITVPWKKTEEEAYKEYFRNNPSKFRLPTLEVTLQFSVLDYQDKL